VQLGEKVEVVGQTVEIERSVIDRHRCECECLAPYNLAFVDGSVEVVRALGRGVSMAPFPLGVFEGAVPPIEAVEATLEPVEAATQTVNEQVDGFGHGRRRDVSSYRPGVYVEGGLGHGRSGSGRVGLLHETDAHGAHRLTAAGGECSELVLGLVD
jgi:hypothetical protein